MQRTMYASVIVGLSVGAGVSEVLAQQIPPLETGTRKVTSRLVNGELEMRDVATGRVIVARQRIEPMRGWAAGVVTNVSLQEQPTGADIIVEATNTTSEIRKAGEIGVGIINLGENVEQLNCTETSLFVPRRASQMTGWAGFYPSELYSPVMVLKNSSMAVGVSIQFPLLDYKNDVRVHVDSPGNFMAQGEAGKGWTVRFALANVNNSAKEREMFQGEIPPGQSRTYVVSLRVTDRPDEWVTTLLPYRDYFRSTYGPVQYVRKTTPVVGITVADPSQISDSNPYGYGNNIRPDINGFGRLKTNLLRQQDWDTTMVWMVSGLYNENRELNFPYQVGSQWNRSPQMQTALDPVNGLPAVAADRELGIWWGRSLALSRTWNSADYIKFDPDNPEHLAIALREVDGIAATGVTLIGLDTFQPDQTPLWKALPWIQTMKDRHPNMSFVTEPAQCDILHTVAPTYVTGYTLFPPANLTDEKQLYVIKGPNILFDFINPGHETWGSMSYHLHRNFLGGVPPADKMLGDFRKWAEWGYRPIFFDFQNKPETVSAAPSWDTSLPTAVVAADPIIQRIKRGRRPNDTTTQQQPSQPGAQPTSGQPTAQPQGNTNTTPRIRQPGVARPGNGPRGPRSSFNRNSSAIVVRAKNLGNTTTNVGDPNQPAPTTPPPQ